MRLIGYVNSEKEAFALYSHLLKKKIHSTYEVTSEPQKVSFWIYEEDQLFEAKKAFEQFKENPNADQFQVEEDQAPSPPPSPKSIAEHRAKEDAPTQAAPPSWNGNGEKKLLSPKIGRAYPLTWLVLLLCVSLFLTERAQGRLPQYQGGIEGYRLTTPILQKLLFTYPLQNQKLDQIIQKHSLKSSDTLESLPPSVANEVKQEIAQAESIPTWRGIYPYFIKKKDPKAKALAVQSLKAPRFVDIKQGQVWRLFTPALLHGGFLHILFNMAWAWILLRQIEVRLSFFKGALLILVLGIISNVAQYLVSGPSFLGFSGVICGLVGFIWMRQKVAPWEGYPLSQSTIRFLFIFVLSLAALEGLSLLITTFTAKSLPLAVGNTAHLSGGIVGILLGKTPLFSRSHR